MGPRSTGSRATVNPLTSSSRAYVRIALSGLRMGRLIGLQTHPPPSTPTPPAPHPVPIKDPVTGGGSGVVDCFGGRTVIVMLMICNPVKKIIGGRGRPECCAHL